MARGGQQLNEKNRRNKEISKKANSPRDRLLSIQRDVNSFLKYVVIFHWLPNNDLNKYQCKLPNEGESQRQSAKWIRTVDTSNWPVVANERCGSWYAYPFSTSYCYFKSTDGHIGTWNFSLKRLNLHLLQTIITASSCSPQNSLSTGHHTNNNSTHHHSQQQQQQQFAHSQGCLIVDASHSKIMPDAFSRTIPIWAAVLNRVIQKLRDQQKTNHNKHQKKHVNQFWDTRLYTPDSCVSNEEHKTIERLLEDRVNVVLSSGIILNPDWLIENIQKPLRPYWITNDNNLVSTHDLKEIEYDFDDTNILRRNSSEIAFPEYSSQYISIVCVSCSSVTPCDGESTTLTSFSSAKPRLMRQNNHLCGHSNHMNYTTDCFYYTPGAADDHESWARGLTPNLFWSHSQSILDLHHKSGSTSTKIHHDLTLIKETENVIKNLVKKAKEEDEEWYIIHNETDNNHQKHQIRMDIMGKEFCYLGPKFIENTFDPSLLLSNSTSKGQQSKGEEDISCYYSTIGSTNLFVGTRRSGRPPQCWNHFHAIVNVTTNEYPNMMNTDLSKTKSSSHVCVKNYSTTHTCSDGNHDEDEENVDSKQIYYLQMPVFEGKRDRTELEKWMAIAMLFIIGHINEGRRVLIHCAQGRDRSVAVAMAVIVLFFRNENDSVSMKGLDENDIKQSGQLQSEGNDQHHYRLQNKMDFWKMDSCFQNMTFKLMESWVYSSSSSLSDNNDHEVERELYKESGMSSQLVEKMMGREGRNLLFTWISKLRSNDGCLDPDSSHASMATKDSLRQALHFIQTFRDKASPTRNTMQKLNRFLMSSSYER